jgi:hypothetical protein
MNRKLLVIISIAAALLLGGLAWSYVAGGPPKVVSVSLSEGPHFSGSLIPLTLVLESSGIGTPDKYVEMKLPKGLEARKQELTVKGRPRLGGWRYEVRIPLQAFEVTTFPESQAKLGVVAESDTNDDTLAFTVPEIVIQPRDQPEATSAAALDSSVLGGRSVWFYIGCALALLVTIAVIRYLLRRGNEADGALTRKIEPPWTLAERALGGLRSSLPLPANEVYVELTDIVRRYIEALYQVPATERTTPEFLKEINRPNSQLSTDHRLLLADFLSSADMVKFARMDATVRQLEESIDKAKEFVVETSEAVRQAQKAEESA